MTTRSVVDSVLTVTRAAVSGSLLSDADSLAAGNEAANWVRSVRGGEWLFPDMPNWLLLSSDHVPNLSVFLSDEDVSTVIAAGQELARRLDQEESLIRHGSDPGWSDWSPSDQRWAEWDDPLPDWLMWDGGPARVSLNVVPARQLTHVRVRPNLHFAIERLDTPRRVSRSTTTVLVGLLAADHRSRGGISLGSPCCPTMSWKCFATTKIPLSLRQSNLAKSFETCTERYGVVLRTKAEAGGVTQQQEAATTPSRDTRIAFWIVAGFGVLAAALVWTWYGLAMAEAESEQGKAIAAGTTMAGFGEIAGGVPLILAHVVGLVALMVLGWKGYRGRGIALAIAAVLISSVIGIGVAQLLWEGELFLHGINHSDFVP